LNPIHCPKSAEIANEVDSVSKDRYAFWKIGPARPEQWRSAFRVLFQGLPEPQRDERVATALRMARAGELDADGIIVVQDEQELLGAILCLPVAGAGGLVWPPQAAVGDAVSLIEDQLTQFGCAWLRQQGTKLAQALLAPDEVQLATPLVRSGFRHVTRLWYLRRDLRLGLVAQDSPFERLSYASYENTRREVFHRTLLLTYQESLDCPEVNGVRSIEEIIAGHKAQGKLGARRWWLALHEAEPAGVLLLSEMPESGSWDISYLGVVPQLRRRGLGRELTTKALIEARTFRASEATLSVDARNLHAWKLYRNLGFEPYGQREVYLALLAVDEPAVGRAAH
jgi:ribosomal protein S18 acetylase RimI-like enzyme